MSFLSAREASGMTQKDVTEKVGVNQSAVSFWESGKTMPRASILLKLANLYGCTVDDLLKDGGE